MLRSTRIPPADRFCPPNFIGSCRRATVQIRYQSTGAPQLLSGTPFRQSCGSGEMPALFDQNEW
jgi:hypothetical protein